MGSAPILVGGDFDVKITIGGGTPQEVEFLSDNESNDIFLMRIAP